MWLPWHSYQIKTLIWEVFVFARTSSCSTTVKTGTVMKRRLPTWWTCGRYGEPSHVLIEHRKRVEDCCCWCVFFFFFFLSHSRLVELQVETKQGLNSWQSTSVIFLWLRADSSRQPTTLAFFSHGKHQTVTVKSKKTTQLEAVIAIKIDGEENPAPLTCIFWPLRLSLHWLNRLFHDCYWHSNINCTITALFCIVLFTVPAYCLLTYVLRQRWAN